MKRIRYGAYGEVDKPGKKATLLTTISAEAYTLLGAIEIWRNDLQSQVHPTVGIRYPNTPHAIVSDAREAIQEPGDGQKRGVPE